MGEWNPFSHSKMNHWSPPNERFICLTYNISATILKIYASKTFFKRLVLVFLCVFILGYTIINITYGSFFFTKILSSFWNIWHTKQHRSFIWIQLQPHTERGKHHSVFHNHHSRSMWLLLFGGSNNPPFQAEFVHWHWFFIKRRVKEEVQVPCLLHFELFALLSDECDRYEHRNRSSVLREAKVFCSGTSIQQLGASAL